VNFFSLASNKLPMSSAIWAFGILTNVFARDSSFGSSIV